MLSCWTGLKHEASGLGALLFPIANTETCGRAHSGDFFADSVTPM